MTNQKTINLSPRLQVIADKVKQGHRIADIGTDHAYIPIYLVQKGIASFAIASDVRKGPLDKAFENIQKYGLEDKINVRLGDGLEKIKEGEVDTIILAGMGGILMCGILSRALPVLKTVKRLILQPMMAQEEVRKWIEANNFRIIDEELAIEGTKIYHVMVAEHGKESIEKDIYYYIGKELIKKKDPLLPKLIHMRVREIKKIIKQLEDKRSENVEVRLKECRARLKEYEKINELLSKE